MAKTNQSKPTTSSFSPNPTSLAAWVSALKSAQKTQMFQDNRRKMHYLFTSASDDSPSAALFDGIEMIEEYDASTSELLLRKIRGRKSILGEQGKWECEIGEDVAPTASSGAQLETSGMTESLSNPVCVRRDTKKAFAWRIRNMPWPLDNYEASIEPADTSAAGNTYTLQHIVIRTKNKKYFKRIALPDAARLRFQLDPSRLALSHALNTLLVTYEKPPEVVALEREIAEAVKKGQTGKDGDVQVCNPS